MGFLQSAKVMSTAGTLGADRSGRFSIPDRSARRDFGLDVRADEAVAWIRVAGLAAFLAEPVADSRGWDGERTWQTNDRDLTTSAVCAHTCTLDRPAGRAGLLADVKR